MGIRWIDGYSADIEMHLVIDGKRIPVSQVGPNFFQLSTTRSIPAGTEGTIIIVVDGREEEHHVFIHQGVEEGRELVSYY